jgi:6-phosphofructokinase 2
MKQIVTLTLNPAIDGAAEAETVGPIHKVRTWAERYDPGGGGINAARVINELGGAAFAVYLSGGTTGPLLDALVRAAGIEGRSVPIAEPTRISYTVHERSSNLEYRFVPEGPAVAPQELQACLAALEAIDCEYLIASGSLPRGVPADFYVRVARLAARKGAKLVLDTSGRALREATDHGVYLIKPSLGELEDLVGQKLPSADQQESVVRRLLDAGAAEIIALTLGRDGALLATRDRLCRIPGLQVTPRSAVGAGDSFLAAMTFGLAQGRSSEDAFALAVAAGTAAVVTMGTELCRRQDVERIYEEIRRGVAPGGAALEKL